MNNWGRCGFAAGTKTPNGVEVKLTQNQFHRILGNNIIILLI